MYQTTDEKITLLEKELKRQAFQIQLLYAIIQNKEKAGIYELLIQMKISESTYHELKRLTISYEENLKDGFVVTLSSFIQEVQWIFDKNEENIHFNDLSHFIPRWLGGTNGNIGFSKALHEHFYN